MPVIGQGVEICTSTTRPSTATIGTMIYETDTASYRWCSNNSPMTWIGMIPVGTVQSFAGSTAPTGWLLCAGQSLNASTSPQYADLWGVLGTTYGGTGIAAFSLPDLRGRAPHGKDDMGGSAASRVTSGVSGITGSTLGASGGSEALHQHTHTQNAHTHTQDAHTHQIRVNSFAGDLPVTLNNQSDGSYYSVGDNVADATNAGRIMYADSRTATNQNTTATNQNTGTGASQNMPPTIILNYIIKY